MELGARERLALNVARKVGVPAPLFLGLIQQESNFDPNARSHAGAMGYTQLMPGTAAGLGIDPSNPYQNLLGGARYLKSQLSRFKNPALALSAYNSGPGGSESAGRIEGFSETQNYVRRVLANQARYSRLLGGSGGSAGTEQVPSRAQGVITPLNTPAMPQSTRGNARLNLLVQGLAAGEDIYDLIGRLPKTPMPSTTPALPALRTAPVPSRGVARPVGGGIRELIHDPMGSIFDGVRSSKPYGGHGGHLHYAPETPQQMLRAITLAQQLGLAVRENPYTDPVDPVHTKGSHHYRLFPGKYNGRSLGEAADISGNPAKLKRLYQLLAGG